MHPSPLMKLKNKVFDSLKKNFWFAGTVVTVLAFLCAGWADQATAQAGDEFPFEFGGPEFESSVEDLSGPEIAEPLFALLVSMAEADSLGSWRGSDVQAHADSLQRASKFPENLVDRITRRRPTTEEQVSWPFAAVLAVWEIDLIEDLDRKMPYSILGYHPGSLRVSRQIKLTEARRGTMAMNRGTEVFLAREVTMFRLDEGHVILDVDGFVDRLLGKGLDDSATIGFVLARDEEQLVGLAVSLGRNGRRIYGEFDFRRDKVLPNGRSWARALSAACRLRMLQGYTGPPLGVWVDD